MLAGVRFLPPAVMMMSFLRPGDRQVAVLVERAEVAGVQPAVLDRAEARGGAVVVAVEDVRALDQDLAVLGDPQLDARERPPDRAEAVVLERRDRRGGGGLGHAVALEHGHAAGVEELEDLVGDRCGAARRLAHVAAEDRAHVLEELLVGLVERRLQLLGDRFAAEDHVAHLARRARRRPAPAPAPPAAGPRSRPGRACRSSRTPAAPTAGTSA